MTTKEQRKTERKRNTARLDIEIKNVAKKFGHMPPDEFVLLIRHRCNVQITEEYAAEVLERWT